MDLNLSQLQAITMGALDIREESDGFHFSRMLPLQVAAFGEANPGVSPRISTSTPEFRS